MASDPDYLNFFACDGLQGQHGSWNDVHSMQRSDSNSTTCTVDSSYTATSSLSGYSSITEYSVGDFTWAPDGTYQKAPAYPDLGHLHEHHDVSHMVSETGSQHQHSGYQLPQPSHRPSRLEQFTTREGREDAAWTATLAANTLIIAQRPYGDGGPTFISSGALEEALQGYLRRGVDEPVRPAVQDVLYQQLHPRIHDVDSYYDDIMRILEEAAYQLQIRLQCPEVLGICFYSLATVLTKLIGDPEEESKGPANVEPVDRRDPSSIPAPNQAEKEKFRCQHPGCEKSASRQADLERHFKIVHLKDEQKTKYLCDHKTCARNMTPFFRHDHFRDHLRITHMEDLLRRGNKGDTEWWASRAILSNWWRCNRCLVRVGLDKHGFVCHRCGSQCEKERQEHRLKAMGRH